jgi:hypothetical protein
MATTQPFCHWKFQGLLDHTVNLADQFELNPAFKASTLPSLGLLDSSNQIRYFGINNQPQDEHRHPWEILKQHVEDLNKKDSNSTRYKFLYITRHGLGYHNVFEAQVGKDAWSVSI